MDRVKEKVIFISGGARGQGAAEARLFVAEGARVVIGDLLEAEGRQLASELGSSATFVRQDVTQERDWETAVNAAEKPGGLHGLVNNAGIFQPRTVLGTPLATITAREWDDLARSRKAAPGGTAYLPNRALDRTFALVTHVRRKVTDGQAGLLAES